MIKGREKEEIYGLDSVLQKVEYFVCLESLERRHSSVVEWVGGPVVQLVAPLGVVLRGAARLGRDEFELKC